MIILDEPYFMKNEEWYFWNEGTWRYELTDKAPKEAIKSYEEYYKILRSGLTKVEIDTDEIVNEYGKK